MYLMYVCNVCMHYVCMYVCMCIIYIYVCVCVCVCVCVLRVYIIEIPELSIFRRLTNLKFGLLLYKTLSSENNCISA